MDVKVLAQMAIKTEELYPEDDRDLNALVEQMKARKAAAEPGGRGNPFLIHSDAGGEELLAQQQQPPNYLSTLLQHGLYTPKQHTFRPLPSLTQEMMTTVEPEVMGMPISGFCAPQSGPELADITASLPAGSSRPKRKFAIVENSDGDSKFEPDSDDEPLNSGRTTSRRSTRGLVRRRRLNDGASSSILAIPEPVMTSSEPSAPDRSMPGAMEVDSPPPGRVFAGMQRSQSTTLKITCRGAVTFHQAQQENGGNYIFQWPLASRGAQIESGDNYFILICDSGKCPESKRGYFWRHPFVPIPGHGVPADSHFHGHLTGEQMLEQYGWNVIDAGQHLDEIEAYNAKLAKKQIPTTKRPKRQARD